MLDMFKDDVTKQWSLSRVSAFTVLIANLSYTGFMIFQNKTFPDVGNNWLILIVTLYGINKGVTAIKSFSTPNNAKVELS